MRSIRVFPVGAQQCEGGGTGCVKNLNSVSLQLNSIERQKGYLTEELLLLLRWLGSFVIFAEFVIFFIFFYICGVPFPRPSLQLLFCVSRLRFMRQLLKLSSKCEDHIFIWFQTPHFTYHFLHSRENMRPTNWPLLSTVWLHSSAGMSTAPAPENFQVHDTIA